MNTYMYPYTMDIIVVPTVVIIFVTHFPRLGATKLKSV